MKNLVFLCLIVSASAHAQSNIVELSKKDVVLNVDISTTQLKRSNSGYSVELLKVLVPELANVTILDHRNVGEAAPCMATTEADFPEQVIQGRPSIEQVKFTITLEKIVRIDTAGVPTCKVSLIESVVGTIRGFKFTHKRVNLVGNRNVGDCR